MASALSLGVVLCAPVENAQPVHFVLEKSTAKYHTIHAMCDAKVPAWHYMSDMTLDRCEEECSNDGECAAYGFDEVANVCETYNKVIQKAYSKKNDHQLCAVKQDDEYHRFYGLCRKNEKLDDAVPFKVVTSGTEGRMTKDDCKEELCDKDPDCKAYEYIPSKETCNIYHDAINFIEEASDGDAVCVIRF